MSLDSKIVEAIATAVEESGQPTALSRRLRAWLEAVADESEDIHDVSATDRHLEVIYEAVTSEDGATEDDVAEEDEG